ncbi:MAG TPA: asparagine--tRNA ligase [Chloroflexota bacterium]|nr:asparagine--tRNA ligase [Chloroflexota bacterium]
MRIRDILQGEPNHDVTVEGWVRTRRTSKAGLTFLELNDGSSLANLQIVAEQTLPNYDEVERLATGSSLRVRGRAVESPASGQRIEVRACAVDLIGASSEDFPLQKKRHSFEYLRTIAHLRHRTNTFGAIARVRNEVSRTIHDYFQSRGYLYVQTPLITAIDAEGAGQMFRVTTLDLDHLSPSDGLVDYSEDLFGRPAYLTVSGQLEAETMALAMRSVYTFGPTFRAENSNTSRHLSEFWMVEPEIAFCDLSGLQDIAEEFIKHIFRSVLENCAEDMNFFNERIDPEVIGTLEHITHSDFERISYTEAIRLLEQSGESFEFPVFWGADLQSEHERYLTEKRFKRPVIVTNYPRSIKAFYMRVNDDERTVAAMDVLVPRIGEIIGGSQREERYDVLIQGMRDHDIDPEQYWWYLDLRRFGTAPHSGFGLGLERTVQFVTGMGNIRDVMPFPRAPGAVEF